MQVFFLFNSGVDPDFGVNFSFNPEIAPKYGKTMVLN